jgi:murein DD-endopeptidase MepM/ murein hydrolase activator NlpD
VSLIDTDFKPRALQKSEKVRKAWPHILVGATVSIIGVAILVVSANSVAIPVKSARDTIGLQLPPEPVQDEPQQVVKENAPKWHQFTVKEGDTLASLFDKADISPQELHTLVSSDRKLKRKLTHLVPGQFVAFKASPDGSKLFEVVHKQDLLTSLRVERNSDDKFQYQVQTREYDKRVTHAIAEIKSSLFEAALDAGLSNSVTMDLAYIFGWDVDFALDIREGDKFKVIYEELYLDGKKVRDGDILAAEFINQGREFKALRYTDASGNADYYTPEGRSMRKAFLRTPVDFTRISSRFGKRYHPILKTKRAHKGVDYAAARGTPIRAAGDGKVIYKGRRGGYGKAIIIKHGTRYSTLYAHMNNYNRHVRLGRYVKQGQIIGYVGSTGRATGPHLHYEFRVNGVHRNPLTVRLPQAESIKKKYREDFMLETRGLLAQLDNFDTTTLALSSF